MTKKFKHGVLYPIDQAPEGVPVMLWKGKENKPFGSGSQRFRGKHGWLDEDGQPVHLNLYPITHFTLWPEPIKPVNSWDEYLDEYGNFKNYADGCLMHLSYMQKYKEQNVQLAKWILNYHGEDA